MAELTVEELIERFKHGGEWRVKQVAKMCGWSVWSVYRYINEGKFAEGSIVRRSERDIRIRGEALAQYLMELQEL